MGGHQLRESYMKRKLLTLTGALLGLALTASTAHAVKIRVQSVIPAKADEVVMLNDFADNVRALTNGEVDIEVLPAGAVVGVKETLEAVDKGLIEGGFAWTHYWSGYHPAAMLFGSPTAGAGLGIDNIAHLRPGFIGCYWYPTTFLQGPSARYE